MQPIFTALEENPIIAALRRREALPLAADSPARVVFLLCGDILCVKEDVALLKKAGKRVFVHMDLLGGIGRDAPAVEYMVRQVQPDGIISTRSQVIRLGKEQGIATVQRFFLVDSQSVALAAETAAVSRPDLAEVMPGICPRVIRSLFQQMKTRIIAGGMVEEKGDILAALAAGAVGVSTSKASLWDV